MDTVTGQQAIHNRKVMVYILSITSRKSLVGMTLSGLEDGLTWNVISWIYVRPIFQ